MRKLLSLVLIISSCYHVFGNSLDSTQTDKLRVGLSFSTDYCFRSISGDASVKWLVDARNDLEDPKIGFTTGLKLNGGINEKFAVEFGILYSDKGEKIKDLVFTNIVGEVTGIVDIVYHYEYLDLPLSLNYIFINKKVKMLLTGGLSVNIFLNYRGVSITDNLDGTSEKKSFSTEEDLEAINLAMLAGVGVEFGISDKLDLRIESIFRNSMTSIIDAPIKQFPYSIGLNIGVFY
ncbi:MAG: outer membrane beta-barrel protein [Flavobacteriales bacterium]|nr:outer membrane beta-barrel protein [Flavobacteriales bacterium]